MHKNVSSSKLVSFLARNRNTVFLWMCFGVHFSYFITFTILGLIPMAGLNCFSTIIYVLFLIFARKSKNSEKIILASYFEIIFFSLFSEMFTKGSYGFITYTLGMIPVVFYLIPSYKGKRFIFQFVGMILAIIMFMVDNFLPTALFPTTYDAAVQYGKIFKFINLIVTLCTIMYTSFFYQVEIDEAKNELNYNCTHDTLTGLYNRRFLYDLIKEPTDEHVSVALLDIDNFKRINDNFGHDVGDDILVAVSGCISEATGELDAYSVRWGGEEFVVYYKDTEIETAYDRINKLCSCISEKVTLPDSKHVTVTAGLVSGQKSDFDKVIKKADDYLYIGKQNGKNRIIWYKNEDMAV